MCLWGCFWMRLTFKWVDKVKVDCPSQCGWPSSNHLKAWVKQKGWPSLSQRDFVVPGHLQTGTSSFFFFIQIETQNLDALSLQPSNKNAIIDSLYCSLWDMDWSCLPALLGLHLAHSLILFTLGPWDMDWSCPPALLGLHVAHSFSRSCDLLIILWANSF